jgi:nucleoside-diphosphate-sugar epimerase
MSEISVFGASGFIGGRFCDLYPNDVVKIPRDLRDPPTSNILYFISTVDNYNINSDLHLDIDTNLTVLMDVLDKVKAKNRPASTVINFISSWFVYGQNNRLPFSEDSECHPTGFYSITKRCAEQMLICWCNTFGYKYRIFRLANVLGEGDQKVSKKKNALQFLINKIVHGQDIELYHGGKVLRDYIYVDDVCNAIRLCLEKGETNQIYNIGTGAPSSMIDIVNEAVTLSDSKSKILHISPPNFHNIVQVRDAYLDVTKLSGLGFKCQYKMSDVTKKLVNYYIGKSYAG